MRETINSDRRRRGMHAMQTMHVKTATAILRRGRFTFTNRTNFTNSPILPLDYAPGRQPLKFGLFRSSKGMTMAVWLP
jgi:hypothetical protein